jgi:hypothetical protein
MNTSKRRLGVATSFKEVDIARASSQRHGSNVRNELKMMAHAMPRMPRKRLDKKPYTGILSKKAIDVVREIL